MNDANPLNDDEKRRLFMTLDAQTKQLERLEQGMFGDEKLKQPGLINDMIYVKRWISAYRLKIAYITGACTAIGYLATKAWEYFTTKH